MYNDTDSGIMFGWVNHAPDDNLHVLTSANLLIVTLVLLGCLWLQHWVDSCRYQLIPASGLTILISMAIGIILRLVVSEASMPVPQFLASFSSKLFYFGLLPPIIFTSGFHLHRHTFYSNFDAICSLAFVGTFLSSVTIGLLIVLLMKYSSNDTTLTSSLTILEGLALGALLSSTDPVATLSIFNRLGIERNLYYLVFGESVLNDAVAIAMFKLMNSAAQNMPHGFSTLDEMLWLPGTMLLNFVIIFVGSSVLGYVTSLILALIFKFNTFGDHHHQQQSVVPLTLILCASFVPFLLAEMLQLSGIVAIFFAGIATRRYVMKNCRESVKVICSTVWECLSHLAETCCFVIMGLVMVFQSQVLLHSSTLTFIALILALCLLSRFVNVFGLVYLTNWKRHWSAVGQSTADDIAIVTSAQTISTKYALMISLAGIRGAVAYALAHEFTDVNGHRKLVVCITSVVILLSILLLGGLTAPLIRCLRLTRDSLSMDLSDEGHSSGPDFESIYLYPLFLRSSAPVEGSNVLSERNLQWNSQVMTNSVGIERSGLSHELRSPQSIAHSSGGGTIHDLPDEIYALSPKLSRRNTICSPKSV